MQAIVPLHCSLGIGAMIFVPVFQYLLVSGWQDTFFVGLAVIHLCFHDVRPLCVVPVLSGIQLPGSSSIIQSC